VLSQQPSSGKDADSEREVFRSAGSTVLSWAWFVVAVIVLADLAVKGRDRAALVAAVAVLAITGTVYSCAWRPRIVAHSGGITVVNPLRDHQVPWAAVTKVDVVNAVRVHCRPAPGATRDKILYSWAVQSSSRSARRAALRRQPSAQPRIRLTPRSLQPPPGAAPRYGEIPEPARDALDRSTAEFTAGRLEERAQHARQAAARLADLQSPAGQAPGTWRAGERAGAGADGPAARNGQPAQNGTAAQGTQAAPGSLAGNGAPGGAQAAAVGLPTAQWAWIPIAAMIAPLALLLIVVLV
jgi:Bacterial PH domain